MHKLRIAFDLDMTLNNMAYTWVSWLRNNIDPGITMSTIKYHGFIHDAYGDAGDAYWKDPACYDEIRPLEDALYYVNSLKEMYDVFIITQTPPGQQAAVKDAWIKQWLGDFRIIHSADKHKHSHGCVLIDDNPAHISRHVRHNEHCHGIVFNHQNRYGWAYPLVNHERVHLVGTYPRLFETIKEISHGNV